MAETLGPTIILTLLGLVPSTIWLLFYLSRDKHPEPRRLILLVFVLGFMTVPIAGLLEVQMNCWLGFDQHLLCFLGSATTPLVGGLASLLAVFGFGALVEEGLKFLAVRLSIWEHPALDEPIDAMMYMVVAALGFAAAENMGNVWGLAQASLSSLSLATIANGTHPAFQLMTLRFFGATLLHTLTSGIVGYFMAIKRFKLVRFGMRGLIGRGLTYAVLIHALFNILIRKWQVLQNPVFGFAVLALLLGAFIILMRDLHALSKRSR